MRQIIFSSIRYNEGEKIMRIIVTLFLLVLLSTTAFAMDQRLDNVLLTEGDTSGFVLTSGAELPSTWNIVNYLPGFMKSPPEQMDSMASKEPVLAETNKDGFRQVWKDSLTQTEVTIDYGVYDSADQARNALCYIAYNRSYWVNIGDLGFEITDEFYGVYDEALYFIKGPYIFMVDSPGNTNEIIFANKILSKI